MNPRQRRGALLIVAAVVGAGAVFVSLLRYTADVRAEVGPDVAVLEIARPIAANEPITADDVRRAERPERWTPDTAIRSVDGLAGLVAAADLAPGAVLQAGMLKEQPAIRSGEREIAILVDAETAVAGKIQRGDHVDVFATFAGSNGTPPTARIVIQRARIVEIGDPTTRDERDGSTFGGDRVIPITFALSVEDSRTLAFAESFATNVRLALRAPDDDEILGEAETVYMPSAPAASGEAAAGDVE